MCAKEALKHSKYSSTTQALMDLHWLLIEQQIQFKILAIKYKAINSNAPKYIMDQIETSKSKRDNMQSNNARKMINIPSVKYKTFAARSFGYAAPTLWNELPKNIRESKTLGNFKKGLKTHLYRKAFNQ